MSGHDSKYFSTTKKGEIPELKEELNSQYKVPPYLSTLTVLISLSLCDLLRLWIGSFAWIQIWARRWGSRRGHSRSAGRFFLWFGRVGRWDFA